MLANYLGTQLPGQMRVNDANHALQVENQVARLAAVLRGAAGVQAIGGVVSQPVVLGSVGAPPFATGDGASIGPGARGSQLTVSFTAVGPVGYHGPGGWPAGGNLDGSGCSFTPLGTQNPTNVTCKGGTTLTQNFTNGSHFISVTGGANLHLNFTTSNSTVVVGATGGVGNTVIVVGSHDNVYLNATGGSGVHMTVVGSWDNVSCSGAGGATVRLMLVGNHDATSWSANGASSSFVESAWGSHDSTTTSNTNAAVYYTGFDAANASTSTCPYGNASNSDTVSGSGGTVNYNNTGYTGSGSSGGWTETWSKVTGQTCPFFSATTEPQKSSGAVGASFVVDLRNTYTPAQIVAFDQGAVVYVQPNGQPRMLVAPSISSSGGNLSAWIPEFRGGVGTEEGTGTAEFSARLVSLLSIDLPSSKFNLSGVTSIAVSSPYAVAWYAYLSGLTASLGGSAVCIPKTSSACVGPFSMNGPLGTVYLNVTATTLALEVATYSVTLG